MMDERCMCGDKPLLRFILRHIHFTPASIRENGRMRIMSFAINLTQGKYVSSSTQNQALNELISDLAFS